METEDKSKIVEEWKKSGMSQAAYCDKNDININTFRAWVRNVAVNKASEEAEKVEVVAEKKPKSVITKPFFVREKGVYIQNVNLGESYRPCRLGEKIDITESMDIDTLKIMRDRGVIALYGVD